MKKNKSIKLFCFILLFFLLSGCENNKSYNSYNENNDFLIEEYENEIENLQSTIEEYENEIESLENHIENLEDERDSYDSELKDCLCKYENCPEVPKIEKTPKIEKRQ